VVLELTSQDKLPLERSYRTAPAASKRTRPIGGGGGLFAVRLEYRAAIDWPYRRRAALC